MLLIEKPLNSRIKASGFATKQAEYSTEKIQDFIDLSNPLNYSNIKSFDFKTIEARSVSILNKYKSHT
jgi:predicted ribonuclease YlaK